jgi:hypothetical protein
MGGLSQWSDYFSYLAFHERRERLFDINPLSYLWPWDRSLSRFYSRGSAAEGEAVFAAIMRAIDMVALL